MNEKVYSKLIQITIPDESSPGSQLTIKSDDNKYYEIVIPNNSNAGDTLHILIPDNTNRSKEDKDSNDDYEEHINDPTSVSTNHTSRNAALIMGTIIGAIIVGPVVTGVAIAGSLAYTVYNNSNNSTTETSDADGDNDASPERLMANNVTRIAHSLCYKIKTFDERVGISNIALKAITKAQEIDERAKLSETVISSAQRVNERFDISGNVSRGYNRIQVCNEQNGITDGISTVGRSLMSCAGGIEEQFHVTDVVTSALTSGAVVVANGIEYMTPTVPNTMERNDITVAEPFTNDSSDTAATEVITEV